MSASRKGKNHLTPEGRKRISEKRQEAARQARAAGLPDHYRCSPCSQREGRNVYKPLKEFPLAKKTLKSGEVAFYPSPRCRACNRERVRAHRAMLGPEERRRRQRRWDQRRRDRKREAQLELSKPLRVDKEPFLRFFFDYIQQHRINFIADLKPPEVGANSGAAPRKDSSDKGVFDSAAFASYCGITKTRYQSLRRMAGANSNVHQIDLSEVERILGALNMEHKLYDLYPELN